MSQQPLWWSLSLYLIAGLAAALPPSREADAESARRPMTPEDLWAMERVGAPALSPDGRWVAFAVTRFSVEENKGDSDLWLMPADGSAPPRRLTWSKGSDSSPAWSPDGKRLAFVAKRGEEQPQLYVLPLEGGGEARPVTDLPVGVQGPRWFPDGKRIAFLAATWPDLNDDWPAVKKRLDEQKEDKTQARASSSRLLRFWDEYRTDGRRLHVVAADVETGEARDLTPGLERFMDFQSAEEEWDVAPDGREIAYTVNTTEPPYAAWNVDVWAVSLDALGKPGTPRNLTAANPATDTAPRYSPDGRWLVYGRNRRVDVDPDFVRLVRLDRKTGEVVPLTDEWDSAPGRWTFTPDGKTLLFHAQERGRTHLYAMPVAGGEPRIVARGGSTAGVEAGPPVRKGGSPRLVFQRQSMLVPTELFTLELEDGLAGKEPRALTTFNAERLSQLDLGTVGEETFTGGGGDPVHMFVVHPPGFDRSRKWPLFQMLHGGPHGALLDEFHYRWNGALFASRGYVVGMVNFHGSTGYGQAFADAILGNHADLPFADVMKATDHLLAQGFVDEKRMAAGGGSYGGYLTAWILGHTDRFAALIDHAGVYDLMGQFASDSTYGRPSNYGASPWTDPERVDLYSPSRFAGSFNTPTLILHGEKDYRVPVTQGINLYGVLQGKGVPARIVIFPDENHWVLKPQAALLWWKEVFAWLDQYIGVGSGER